MKIRRLPLILSILVILILSSFIAFYPTGAPAGYTGSPGDGKNCTECHGGTATAVTGWITSNIPVEGYVAGQTYQITASNSITGSGKYGFEVSPQNNAGTLLGTLAAGTNSQLVGNNKYVTHTSASTTINTWTFNWTAPAAGTGQVTFYGAFARNKPGPVRLSTLTIAEQAATPPAGAGPITGQTDVCKNNVYNYSVATITGATNYVWSVPSGATIASGQGTTSISVSYGTSSSSGNLSVYGSNTAGNGAASSLNITVNQAPDLPATPAGPTQVDLRLVTSSTYNTTGSASASSYSWEINPPAAGTIAGNGLSATVTWANYLGQANIHVKAVNICGESAWSASFVTEVINTTGGINAEINNPMKVYPNPSDGLIQVEILEKMAGNTMTLEVIDYKGAGLKIIEIQLVEENVCKIDLSDLSSGIYFLKLNSKDASFISKICLQ